MQGSKEDNIRAAVEDILTKNANKEMSAHKRNDRDGVKSVDMRNLPAQKNFNMY